MFYLVERTDEISWDEYDAFVVKADSEKEALMIAQEKAGNKFWGSEEPFFRVENTTITELTDAMENGEILGSFNAG
jgi:hypothetical protein